MDIAKLQSTFFNSAEIRYQIKDDDLWICAVDIAKPLGVTDRSVRKNISTIPTEWFQELTVPGANGTRNALFVNKSGLLKILMKMNAKKGSIVDDFQNWAVTKLDELLTTGRTQIQKAISDKEYKLEMKKLSIKEIEFKTRRIESDRQFAQDCYNQFHDHPDIALKQRSIDFLANTLDSNAPNQEHNKTNDGTIKNRQIQYFNWFFLSKKMESNTR